LVVMRNEPFVPSDYGMADSKLGPVPATQAIVRLSHFGGTTRFTSPPCHISLPLSDPIGLVEQALIFLTGPGKAIVKTFAEVLALPASIFVEGDLLAVSPQYWCYGEYVWERDGADPIGDVDFDLPLPTTKPSGTDHPSYLIADIASHPGSNSTQCGEAMTLIYNPSTNSYRIHIPACQTTLQAIYDTTFSIFAFWAAGSTPIGDPEAQSLSVCFRPQYLKAHGPSDEEDPRLYVAANGHFASEITDTTSTCVNTNLSAGQPLVVSAHGFECDVSCGEQVPLGRFVEEPNDVLGQVLYAIPADEVLSGDNEHIVPLPMSFSVCSQPVFGISQRQAALTHCDYKLNFSIHPRTN
jgi:hypothetical protein